MNFNVRSVIYAECVDNKSLDTKRHGSLATTFLNKQNRVFVQFASANTEKENRNGIL